MSKNINLDIDYPLMCTKGAAIFPNNDMTIDAGRVFSKKALTIASDQFTNHIVVAPQYNPNTDEISTDTVSASSKWQVSTRQL